MILTSISRARKAYLVICFNLALFCAIISTPHNSYAVDADELAIDAAIGNLQNYLGNLGDTVIEFSQESLKSKPARGAVLLSKPHRFRVNYYPPFPLLIIGNKNFISLYDYEMHELSRIDAQKNNFNFFLLNNTEFRKRYEVRQASFDADSAVIKFYDSETGALSQITFNKKTGKPQYLHIFEEKDIITFRFSKIWQIGSFTKKQKQQLFSIQNPDIFGPPKIIQQQDIANILQKNKAKSG